MRRAAGLLAAGLGAIALGTAAAPQATAVAITHHPRVGAAIRTGSNLGWASSNWSGYAVTGGNGAFTP